MNKPELLSPAGDQTCLIAAIENGADAVYFGLQGHNARARAENFSVESLGETMDLLHSRGVKGYVALNTLVFPKELAELGETVRLVAQADVDAVIVQDIGLARLIREVAPELPMHASTQMSITSGEGMRLAEDLGCERVILARELSLDEIAHIRKISTLPIEVFVHGALCVAYSGQCLTSEALGGRSANRGECAQACRMPYQIVKDGEIQDLAQSKFLLSPQDLAAFDLVPDLIRLGVASLKIEGRLKTPEYVANITAHYRKAIDQACSEQVVAFSSDDVREMELSFSRGFSKGFLGGTNHKILVRGDYAKKRGVLVGRILEVVGDRVRVDLDAPVKPGDGLVFDGDEDQGTPEQGGRVYEVVPLRSNAPSRTADRTEARKERVDLGFGKRDINTRELRVGQRLWKTDDPELTKRLRKTFEGPPKRKVRLNLTLSARVGFPLSLSGATDSGLTASVVSVHPLERANNQSADAAQVREQVDRLGDTLFRLGDCQVELEGGPMIPKSLLNQLRRDLIGKLEGSRTRRHRTIGPIEPALQLLGSATGSSESEPTSTPLLAVLCRTLVQVEAASELGVDRIYADFQEIKQYARAVEQVKGRTPIYLATPRIQKPGEANIFGYLAKQGASGLLVRNAGGLFYCVDRAISFVADYSMNAANELTVAYLLQKGADRVTASYDLAFEQLDDLACHVPLERLEVVVHQQIPMFHMEHCVFCAFLSPGTDKTNCGRPCDLHDVKLLDRVGMQHPLQADVGCRNTLFNAVPQTAAEYLPRMRRRGVSRFRVEFLNDSPDDVRRIVRLYQAAIAADRDVRTLWRDLKATSKYGVTRGSLAILN